MTGEFDNLDLPDVLVLGDPGAAFEGLPDVVFQLSAGDFESGFEQLQPARPVPRKSRADHLADARDAKKAKHDAAASSKAIESIGRDKFVATYTKISGRCEA